jgi:raffinose/stachyose/melibiose transport system substrate-binding protein
MSTLQKILSIVVCLLIAATLFAAGNQEAGAKEKSVVKFYGKVVEYTSGPMMTDAVIEMLKDEYVVESIQVDWGNQDQVIRTGIASGDPCDVYNYAPDRMPNFKDMAIDLKPYLDADPEWAAQFNQGAIDAGTFDGKVLNIPWEQNFTVVLANKTILDELGIVIPDAWTIEEFSVVADQIKDAGYYPFANAMDHNRAAWLFRNALLSVLASEGDAENFDPNNFDLASDASRKALTAVKTLFDNDYMYPGVGSVTVKGDEVKAGFYQGKVLMMTDIAAGAKQSSLPADFEVVTVPWPSADAVGAILGSYNGFFIPQNTKNIDGAVAAIKAFTSEEVQSIHGAEGYIPANNKIQIKDPFVNAVLKKASTMKDEYIYTSEQRQYFSQGIIPDLILGGGIDVCLETLDSLQ